MKRFVLPLSIAILFLFSPAIRAAGIHVAVGESIQKAIDAAPDGTVIQIDAGVFEERLEITRPVTLEGAGWDKTILKAKDQAAARSDAEKIAFADRIAAAKSERDQFQIVHEFTHPSLQPTIRITNVKNFSLQGIGVRCPPLAKPQGLGADALVEFNNAQGEMSDCSVIGPCMNGIAIRNGSNIELRQSLVAAMWNTGVVIYPGSDRQDQSAKAHLVDCDIRNCYSRCITINCEGSTVEKCRISGSAWHGIRYDHCSPTIVDNLIFANARSGIYASGATSAVIRGNIFWKNEMDGISCWFNNSDTIEGNTFVDNLREGIAVCGDAAPNLTRNIFAGNPIGIACMQINQNGQGTGDPQPAMQGNYFWSNHSDVARQDKPESAPEGSTQADPKFVDEAKQNFELKEDSPARAGKIGAVTLIAFQSPWPVQAEEMSIIPDSDTRDFSKWKNAVVEK